MYYTKLRYSPKRLGGWGWVLKANSALRAKPSPKQVALNFKLVIFGDSRALFFAFFFLFYDFNSVVGFVVPKDTFFNHFGVSVFQAQIQQPPLCNIML